MAFNPHGRLVFEGVRGTVLAPRERWAVRLNLLQAIPAASGAAPQSALNALGTQWQTSFGQYLFSDCRLTSVKWAFIGADGRYTGAPVLSAPLDLAGSATTNRYPDQVALAVTLDTARRGPRGRGRFYLPGIAVGLATDGLIVDVMAKNIANSAATFVNAVNAAWPDNGGVAIASTFAEINLVTSVRVGRVLDTIRSRRSSLIEGYSTPTGVTQ